MLTSRERVLTALDHREPDRVPIDLGGNQTGIHKTAYRNLLDHLGLDEELEILDLIQQLARPSEAVLERLHVDTRYVFAGGATDFDGIVVKRERDGRLWSDFTVDGLLRRGRNSQLSTGTGAGSSAFSFSRENFVEGAAQG